MADGQKFYINGKWVAPLQPVPYCVENPATEEACAEILLGGEKDIAAAVEAACNAFAVFSQSSIAERQGFLRKLAEGYSRHAPRLAKTVSMEMGAPITLSEESQVPSGLRHIEAMIEVLDSFSFEEDHEGTLLIYEAIGAVGLITPWNWPLNQIGCKIAPAIAAGCPMVLKPSEIAPLNALIIAEIMEEIGLPSGAFNLVLGDGERAGRALSGAVGLELISFTGSTRAGIDIAQNAAPSIKRVAQELGGKTPNILLDDVVLEEAVAQGVRECMGNSGQSCNAPTRMIVPESLHREAVEIAKAEAERIIVGEPMDRRTEMGPLSCKRQYERVLAHLNTAEGENMQKVCGGVERPEGLERGYYIAPTIFASVDNQMTLAREEIFGPVLAILPYKSEEQAMQIANDTPYGLDAHICSADMERARNMARKFRTGSVHINYAMRSPFMPFGGSKCSGNGREWGKYGLKEYLELKSIAGYQSMHK